tara:strand:- start:227 stop:916 length:690 start_codon:yes stop_codon:yes gene_type:complete
MDGVVPQLPHLKRVCKAMLAMNAEGSTTSEGVAWTSESSNDGLIVESAAVPGLSARRFRAVTRLPCSASFFRDSCIAMDERLKWDTAVANYTELLGPGKCGANTTVWHLAVNGAFGVAGRDFVDFGVVEADSDGTVWSYGQSVQAEDVQSGDCVRGVNYPGSGWRVRPIKSGSDSFECECSYVVLSDLKGWLPSAIVRMAMSGQFADFFRLARAHIEKRLEGGATDDGP